LSSEYVAGNRKGSGTAYPDNPDPALPYRRADCGNGVTNIHEKYQLKVKVKVEVNWLRIGPVISCLTSTVSSTCP
jgi:hypothetical protein